MTSASVARASIVADSANRRPCWNRSRSGPKIGASTANGAVHAASLLRTEARWGALMRDTGWVSMTAAPADPVLADAADAARAAVEAEAPGLVGEHLGVEMVGEREGTHLFATLDPAYRG